MDLWLREMGTLFCSGSVAEGNRGTLGTSGSWRKWGHFGSVAEGNRDTLDLWLREIGTLLAPVDGLEKMGTLLVAEGNWDTFLQWMSG